MNPINLENSFEKVVEYCSPRIISSVENCYVKVAKVIGTLPFHTHENEDELFIIHNGEMIMELEDKKIQLSKGDIYLVKKGIRHRAVAEEVCEVVLIEKKTTSHTGSDKTEITRTLSEQLRPL